MEHRALRPAALALALLASGFPIACASEAPSSTSSRAAKQPTAETPAPGTVAQASSSPGDPGDAQRGEVLYGLHCAVCHGAQGAGDGEAAYLLSPAPRDFTSGRFRLVSTLNGAPTDDDLLSTLERGMPGSAMPAWEWLSASDRASLVVHVRRLALDGMVERLLRQAEEDEETMERAEALEIAQHRLTPGEPVPAVAAADPDDPLVHQTARRAFLSACALCHGADGTGRGVEDQWNEDGTPARPRDFRAGVFKGGGTHEDMVRRLLAGMPGSPMPTAAFASPEEGAAVAAYVLSLAEDGAQERALQKRRGLVAARAAHVPEAPDAQEWARAEPVWLPLMPLWWREDLVEGVVVRALHDGERLAVRVAWEDDTRDEELLVQDAFGDMTALQLTRAAEPPLLTMGEVGVPVDIWSWRAAWERDLGRPRDVVDLYPNTPPDVWATTDAPSTPLYLSARAAGNPLSSATRAHAGESLVAEGFGTLTTRPSHGGPAAEHAGEQQHEPFRAVGSWKDGSWNVVFVRSLAACCAGEVALEPGERVFLAAAVWDGAQGDRDGQKSVTVWHTLELAP